MERIIDNEWRDRGDGVERAAVLAAADTPEGFGLERLRAAREAKVELTPGAGHLLSVVKGRLELETRDVGALELEVGAHVYVPLGGAEVRLEAGGEVVHLHTESEAQAEGMHTVVRHERFLAACAEDGHLLRWILTPQYLSRRVFLHHDSPLRSREGRPVSWFRTTMFDVGGLPPNDDGEPAFRMSYDSRTEFNVCYDVQGAARVRFARHPYVDEGQTWSAWKPLTSDSTYHLDEAAGGPEEETWTDDQGRRRTLRNRHEVSLAEGHASLFCLFDPAPTGIEQHIPGTYSDYEPFEIVSERPAYAKHIAAMTDFDAMVDRLSLAQAQGRLQAEEGGATWALFERGRAEQRAIEAALRDRLEREGGGRAAVVARWMQ